MERTFKGMLFATAAGAVMLTAASAQAAFCPTDSSGTRTLELNGSPSSATCYAYGDGAMQAGTSSDQMLFGTGTTYPSGKLPNDLVEFLGKNDADDDSFDPLTFTIDPEGSDVFSASSGLWELDTSGLTGFDNFIVGFQTGTPTNREPDWAAFLLNGKTSGTWSISDGQELSNYSLYGVVPLPAAAWMMIGGLGLIGGAVARSRRGTAADA